MKMEECTVTAVFPERGTVRVKREQSDGIISAELPIVFKWTLKNQEYTMPAIGEPVICIFNGSVGYVMGAIYSDVSTPPVKDANKHYIRFEDGTFVEYDTKEQVLTVKSEGNVIVQGKNILMN
ncbi:Phage P2 baseplate assembly protein gpV [Lysinibacillus capsici]|uniref:Phage P2 baseplate assembly protein gpV n=1 Tax=Lysinibacillus capsici TaxID=2115968 RepID=A0A2X0XE76_9BACI|nr:phage baseplate assembly protein V [Lysinibacillus capsici]SPT95553.1 Phage P2 baseplate assembly protein gpV [Lysinibacillus capsici]